MPNPQLDAFTARLGRDGLREVEIAVALIWFATHGADHRTEVTAKEVASLMVSQRLSGNVNASRLATNLAKHPAIVRGHTAGAFRIRASRDAEMTTKYFSHADLSSAPVSDLLISDGINLGNRQHLNAIRREANGAYERAFYNSAAVMCRRLAEVLLIETFHAAGTVDNVRDDNNNIKPFSDLIAAAKSGRHFKLSRTAPGSLDRVKQLGDAAAHHRHYLVAKKDLNDLNPSFSLLISELAALSIR